MFKLTLTGSPTSPLKKRLSFTFYINSVVLKRMTFEEDLTKRRIDVTAFAAGDPEKFAAWQLLYQQVHPNTFYTSVKMIINDVRRRFWLPEVSKQAAVATAPAAAKPVIRRATGTVPSTASAIPDEPSPSVDRTPEPAPAPRGRAVIRRAAPAANSENPAEKDITQEPSSSPVNETANPETPKPGRARPVFRRLTAEPDANALSEVKSETENSAPVTTESINTPAEPPKPARPRPVFRKPGTPATSTAEGEAAKSVPADASTTPIPEHSNPDPTEVPKPPRPRPVFKRPTPAAPDPEKTTVTPQDSAVALSQPETVEEKPQEVAAETTKPPRPRPIFKRPAAASTTANPEEKPEAIQPENAPENVPTADTPKFPRPRPVIKRPVAAAETQMTETQVGNIPVTESTTPVSAEPENKNLEQNLNVTVPAQDATPALEIKVEPVVPKTPRPRPVFKKPVKSEPTTDARENKPEAE